MITIQTKKPREVNSWRAAGILYGDLGTSKAYVLGLTFALASYSSFWFILIVSILTLLVGLNYIEICKLYPNGGGVYTSARNRSKVLALIGGFFIISDYIVTAALSAVSAFHYLGVSHPEYWAILSIGIIGLFNLVGPKNTGNLAIGIALPTVICIICLGAFSLPFLSKAIHNLTPMFGNLKVDWNIFVGIIVALSGIESIANTTGSMKLDPGSTDENPSVGKTSTPAILVVVMEVCIFTSLLGLAMNALPGLEINNGDVTAPNYPNVRDAMLRYMAEIFGGSLFGAIFGQFFSLIISVVITLLLLSAVNTALIALISLLFIMSKDGEMPNIFQKLNSFGVPIYPTLVAFLLPIFVLLFISDISGLASLYAIGFVGAIAVNLGATSTNPAVSLKTWNRIFMFSIFVVMLLIEITLFIDKPHARIFVLSILGLGLLMRALVAERKEKVEEKVEEKVSKKISWTTIPENIAESSLLAITGINKSLDFALEEAKKNNLSLYILFVREQRFVTTMDQNRSWTEDKEASEVFNHVLALAPKIPIEFLYNVTSHIAYSIIEIANLKKVNKIIIGRKRGFSFLHFLRGTTIGELVKLLPKNIDLLVVY
jgi:amino acid transporter